MKTFISSLAFFVSVFSAGYATEPNGGIRPVASQVGSKVGGALRSLRVESETPAKVFIARFNLSKMDNDLSESGQTPVTIQIPRGDITGFGIQVVFDGDGTKLDITPFLLERMTRGKDSILIPAPKYGEPPENDAAIAAVKADLETSLIDPTSPLFKWGDFSKALFQGEDGYKYCWRLTFLLNSKNRMGGYTGWKDSKAYFESGKLIFVFVPQR